MSVDRWQKSTLPGKSWRRKKCLRFHQHCFGVQSAYFNFDGPDLRWLLGASLFLQKKSTSECFDRQTMWHSKIRQISTPIFQLRTGGSQSVSHSHKYLIYLMVLYSAIAVTVPIVIIISLHISFHCFDFDYCCYFLILSYLFYHIIIFVTFL